MKIFFKKNKLLILLFFSLFVFILSFALGLHNATLYEPNHGFDGSGHVFYIKYLFKNHTLPPPNLAWETHQSPLYYIFGAILMTLTGYWKSAQYLNIFILWGIILMVSLGLWKVFKNLNQTLIGMYALMALPMLNIFPAMITNELLNTFWIISVAISMIYILYSKNIKEFIIYMIWFSLSFILGIWTKVSIIIILPTVFLTLLILYIKNSLNRKKILFISFLFFFFITIFIMPIFLRANKEDSTSNVVGRILTRNYELRQLDFYYRLDWIPKVDMYNTQYYSMLGGAWNSFWSDGHNAITPFIKFHKKAFILWSLGFILLPLCLKGLKKLKKDNKYIGILMYCLGLSMIMVYLYITEHGDYSGVRLTYEMGIVVPYSFGLASLSSNNKFKKLIFVLLTIQFLVMVSFYWIQPWWHVTR